MGRAGLGERRRERCPSCTESRWRGRRDDPYNHGEEQGKREEGRPARDGSRTRWEIIS